MAFRALLAVALAGVVGCANAQVALTVDLRSDFVIGPEIASARTTVAAGDRVVTTTTYELVSGDLVEGLRIAEVRALAPGEYVVRVDALGPDRA